MKSLTHKNIKYVSTKHMLHVYCKKTTLPAKDFFEAVTIMYQRRIDRCNVYSPKLSVTEEGYRVLIQYSYDTPPKKTELVSLFTDGTISFEYQDMSVRNAFISLPIGEIVKLTSCVTRSTITPSEERRPNIVDMLWTTHFREAMRHPNSLPDMPYGRIEIPYDICYGQRIRNHCGVKTSQWYRCDCKIGLNVFVNINRNRNQASIKTNRYEYPSINIDATIIDVTKKTVILMNNGEPFIVRSSNNELIKEARISIKRKMPAFEAMQYTNIVEKDKKVLFTINKDIFEIAKRTKIATVKGVFFNVIFFDKIILGSHRLSKWFRGKRCSSTSIATLDRLILISYAILLQTMGYVKLIKRKNKTVEIIIL